MNKEAIIVGGGPSGMAAAISLKEQGIEKVLVIERDLKLGGILNQCIHDGFGLIRFEENYTGPEYASIFEKRLLACGVETLTDAMVLNIHLQQNIQNQTDEFKSGGGSSSGYGSTLGGGLSSSDGSTSTKKVLKTVTVRTPEGDRFYTTEAVILATGCRERPRGALTIAGTRPAGIYTAGTAQSFVNLHGLMPGREIVILGSGDIGLIMARRLTLEGAHVIAVVEKESSVGGLPRNIVQCLNDYGIPLILNATITAIQGTSRVTGVEITELDSLESGKTPKSRIIPCDTLILSVGLIPENEVGLSAGIEVDEHTGEPITDDFGHTDVDGVFCCGNALFVHDLVDDVSMEAERLGRIVARYLHGEDLSKITGPKIIHRRKKTAVSGTSTKTKSIICILCPNSCVLTYSDSLDIKGAMCGKGPAYLMREIFSPERILTSAIKVLQGERPIVSVRTTAEIPKDRLMEAMILIRSLEVYAPVLQGQILAKNFLIHGIDLMATSFCDKINV